MSAFGHGGQARVRIDDEVMPAWLVRQRFSRPGSSPDYDYVLMGKLSIGLRQEGWTCPGISHRMLFRCFGVKPEKSTCGSFRPRSSTQFAVVRVELLEDRFLLSGGTARGRWGPISTPDLSLPALIDNASQASGTVSPATQKVTVPIDAASVGARQGTSGNVVALPASSQQAPAVAASTDKQTSGGTSGSSGVPGSAGQNGSVNSGSSTLTPPAIGFCSVAGATGSSSSGAGVATPSQPLSLSPPSSTQASSISPPLPMPGGVPAGGIFKQIAAHSTSANVGLLNLDPVASDLSLSSPAATGSSVVPTGIHGGQPASLVAQPATTRLGFRLVTTKMLSSSDSIPDVVPIETPARPGGERAELPEITALASDVVPERAVSELVEFGDPNSSNGSITEPTMRAQEWVVLVPSPGLPIPIDPGKAQMAESDRKERRIPPIFAVYSSALLTVAVSAPGLASMIRRGKGLDRRRPTVAAGCRAPGSPR